MEKICIECPKRRGNLCDGRCPDEVYQRELSGGGVLEKVLGEKCEWPTLPKINEKIDGFKDFWVNLSPQQQALLSFLLAGFDRKEICQHTETTEKVFSVQMHRIQEKSKSLLDRNTLLRDGFSKEDSAMNKQGAGPLRRIEVKLRIGPLPVFAEEVRFFIENEKDKELTLELYTRIIEPMLQRHLGQFNDEMQGMRVAFDLVKKAGEKGLDIEQVFSHEELRYELLEELSQEENA